MWTRQFVLRACASSTEMCWLCCRRVFFSSLLAKTHIWLWRGTCKTVNLKIRVLSVCYTSAEIMLRICCCFLRPKTVCKKICIFYNQENLLGYQMKSWSPLRQHLAQVGSSILHPFWQNIWEWWRPLDRLHGLASLKVECQRSLGGQPICQSGTATMQTGC